MTMVLDVRPFALVAALLAAAVTGCLSSKRGDVPLTEKCTFDWNGRVLPYRLHRPPCAEGTRYPLVLFLHGAGERGEDNVKTLVHGVVPICRYAMKHGDAFVVAPQCPEGRRWVDRDWSAPSMRRPADPSDEMAAVMALLKDFCATHPVDPARIYVTGISMGGFGTWDLVSRLPGVFAAMMPICGGVDETTAELYRDDGLSVRFFHGGSDGTVTPDYSRRMDKALAAAGIPHSYTEYPGIDHNSWTQTYADDAVLGWLFAQSRVDAAGKGVIDAGALVRPADSAIDALVTVGPLIDEAAVACTNGSVKVLPLTTNDAATAVRNQAVNRELRFFCDGKRTVWGGPEAGQPCREETTHLWITKNEGGRIVRWWLDRLREKRDAVRASDGEFDIAMLGDSITHWWELPFGQEISADLRRTYSVLNLGFGGDSSANLLWRCRNGELDGYRAKVVTVMIGTNDVFGDVPEIVDRIKAIVSLVREKQPQAKILLMAIFPRCDPLQGHLRARSVWVSRQLEELADDEHVFWRDYRPLFLEEDGTGRFDLLLDGTHPSQTGLCAWRDAMLPDFARFTGKVHRPSDAVKPSCARRWILYRSDLSDAESVRQANEFVTRAQAVGYNGVCLDAFEGCAGWDAAAEKRLADVKTVCRQIGLQIVPVLNPAADLAAQAERVRRLTDPETWIVTTNGISDVVRKVAPRVETVVYGKKDAPRMAFAEVDAYEAYYLHGLAHDFLTAYEAKGPKDGFVYWSPKGDYRFMTDAVRLAMRQK